MKILNVVKNRVGWAPTSLLTTVEFSLSPVLLKRAMGKKYPYPLVSQEMATLKGPPCPGTF